MKEDKVSCKEVMSHICESLGEDLNSPKCIDIKSHLEGCPSCQNYFESVDSTITFYKKYNVELDSEGHNRLLSVMGLDEKDED